MINSNGTILTNWHVVENAVKVTVSFEHSKTVEAKVVGKDPSNDLAVLRVPTEGLTLHPLTLGDSSNVEVGEPVLAIGNPFGLSRTLTTGVISALQRQITAPNGFEIDNVLQTDAPINPGNSGGPLLNAPGEVIGINSQIETGGSGSDGNVGIGFAVPINTAKTELPELEKGGNDPRRVPRRQHAHDRPLALEPEPAGQERRARRESRSGHRRGEGRASTPATSKRRSAATKSTSAATSSSGSTAKRSRAPKNSPPTSARRNPATRSRSNCCARIGHGRLHQEDDHRDARRASQLGSEPEHAGIDPSRAPFDIEGGAAGRAQRGTASASGCRSRP